jgi:hypothetical protein
METRVLFGQFEFLNDLFMATITIVAFIPCIIVCVKKLSFCFFSLGLIFHLPVGENMVVFGVDTVFSLQPAAAATQQYFTLKTSI